MISTVLTNVNKLTLNIMDNKGELTKEIWSF